MLCLFVLGSLVFSGCGESDYVRNDDYEKMPEPDYALRQLLGVRTLRTSFEMPEEMRSFRTGLIFIVDGKVTGSGGWTLGDGLHTFGADGNKYAKTIQVEYMNWKDDDLWRGYFRTVPAALWSSHQVNEDFWNGIEADALRNHGSAVPPHGWPFGNFTVLGAWYASSGGGNMGTLDAILKGWDYVVLLVVDFSAEIPESLGRPQNSPSNEELQKILEDHL